MKLSIIIPAYNAAKYIERCVESIMSQDFLDMEILIIDDGSTDDTLGICERIQHKHHHIKVLSKDNGGVSCARNYGIDNAVGEYLMFMDADDYLLPHSLSKAMGIVTANPSVDYFAYGFDRISRNGTLTHSLFQPYQYDNNSMIEYIEKTDALSLGAPWSKIFKRSFIELNHLRFELGRKLFEDICFNLNVLKNCDSLITSDISLYCYDVNNQSATVKFNGNKFIDDARNYLSTVKEVAEVMSVRQQRSNLSEKILGNTRKTICYNALYEIYNSYRIRRNPFKYRDLKHMSGFMQEIDELWHLEFTTGFPRIFVRLYRIHPRCADIALRALFTFKH